MAPMGSATPAPARLAWAAAIMGTHQAESLASLGDFGRQHQAQLVDRRLGVVGLDEAKRVNHHPAVGVGGVEVVWAGAAPAKAFGAAGSAFCKRRRAFLRA